MVYPKHLELQHFSLHVAGWLNNEYLASLQVRNHEGIWITRDRALFEKRSTRVRRRMFDTDLHYQNQALTLLHEMGHLSQLYKFAPFLPVGGTLGIGIGLGVDMATGPEDRSRKGCGGASNKCYADWPLNTKSHFFSSDNDPAGLARQFEQGEKGAYNDMLKNIDNYVCYMWNRWVNRGLCMIDII